MKKALWLTLFCSVAPLAWAATPLDTSGLTRGKEPVPTYLKGAKIKIQLPNGKVFEGNSEDFKVVLRQQKKKPAKALLAKTKPKPKIVVKEIVKEVEVEKIVTKEVRKKFFLGVYAGMGPNGLSYQADTIMDRATVEQKRTPLFGLNLGANVTPVWGMSGLLLNNETFMLGAHFNFDAK